MRTGKYSSAATTFIDATTMSASTSNLIYLGQWSGDNYDSEPPKPSKASHEDPVAWLRRRVDEVCFKPDA